MISLLAAAALARSAPASLVLVRGGSVQSARIWDVQDTTIDATRPNANFGGEAVLDGGPNRTILIRFGDIARVVGRNEKIEKATLVFTPTGGGAAASTRIARVLVPWGPGPFQTLTALIPPVAKDPAKKDDGKKDEGPAAPRGSATWRNRRAGEGSIGWQTPGAMGQLDAETIADAKVVASDKAVRIEGLAAAVQEMADHPQQNYGFALNFETPVDFASSKSDIGRPQLEIETSNITPKEGPDLCIASISRLDDSGKLPNEGAATKFVATLVNLGSKAINGFETTWSVDERAGSVHSEPAKIEPGGTTTLTYSAPFRPDKNDHRFQSVGLRVHAKDDVNPRNDVLVVPTGGKAVEVAVSPAVASELKAAGIAPEEWVQDQADYFNDVYLGESRFSFAADGAKERVAVQRVVVTGDNTPSTDGSPRVVVASREPLEFYRSLAHAIGLVDRSGTASKESTDRFPGLLGYGDTRFEGLLPNQVELPYEPYANPLVDTYPLEANGLLAATDVAALNASLGGPALEVPKTILLRAATLANAPLENTELAFFAAGGGKAPDLSKPSFTLTTAKGGTVIVPTNFGTEPDAAYLVRASGNGGQAFAWLKAWQALDAASRGNRAAAIMDLRFNLPGAPLEASTNLATDRIVTDSGNSLPAKLAALNDGQASTTAALGDKVGDWVEIDLGRDRTIGEIQVIAKTMWSKFDIVSRITGQRPDEGRIWVRELDSDWTLRNRGQASGDATMVTYHGIPDRFRYIRLVNRSGGPASVAEIRIVPAVVAAGQ